MNENGGKNNTILLTVIAIATLLVVVTGATFAYFAAVVRGNENASSISITAASQGTTITASGGEPVELQNIYPRGTTAGSEWATKTLTLTSTKNEGNTGTSVYTFKINVDESNDFRLHDSQGNAITDNDKNDIKNIKFTFTNVPVEGTTIQKEKGTPNAVSVFEASDNGTVIGTGVVSNANANTVKYELKVFYDNASYNQNDGRDTERVFTFHVTYDWKDSKDTTVRP